MVAFGTGQRSGIQRHQQNAPSAQARITGMSLVFGPCESVMATRSPPTHGPCPTSSSKVSAVSTAKRTATNMRECT